MKLLLHIGTEKTGTTSIQGALEIARDSLIQGGVYVPSCLGGSNPRELATYTMRAGRDDDVFPQGAPDDLQKKAIDLEIENKFHLELDELPASIHTVIICCEQLHSRLIHGDEVMKLCTLFRQRFDQIQMICYLRPQVDLATSLYTTALWYRSKLTLPEFVYVHHATNPLYYDYSKLLDRWASAVGSSSITIRRFDKNSLEDSDIVTDFFIHGIGDSSLMSGAGTIARKNASLSVNGQRLLLLYNRCIRDLAEKITRGRSTRFTRNFLRKYFSGKGARLDAEARPTFQALFSAGNAKVAANYFNDNTGLF